MKPMKITRTIHGEEIEIALTLEEIWKAKESLEIMIYMGEIQRRFKKEIPQDELMKYAEEMRDYIICRDWSYYGALDAVCENNDLQSLYCEF